jgi:hypothetical protein
MVEEGGRREALPKNSLTLTGNKEKKKNASRKYN